MTTTSQPSAHVATRRWKDAFLVALVAGSLISFIICPVSARSVAIFMAFGACAGVLLSAEVAGLYAVVVVMYVAGMEAAVVRWFPDSPSHWWQPDLLSLTAALLTYRLARPWVAKIIP